MVVIVVLFLAFLICYLKILFWGNPDLLRTEEHIFRMKALELLGDQNNMVNESLDGPAKNNPALPNPAETNVTPPYNNSDIKKV